ncbi:MAG TPA: carboxymuconolactone decarboxylase family protein [Acidimicrobiales bacterium]|nr:carboxymuconolactone decarboxylase family protein [Acidimicrobiales bacterium]
MAHVTLDDSPAGMIPKMALAYARRKFGTVVDPVKAATHHAGVLVGWGALETAAERGWRKLDLHLRWLAIQATAGAIGCSWCTDFGFYEGVQQGVDPAKVRDVPRWRSSDAYDERERTVLEYAEAATTTPVVVPDELVQRLHEHFSEAQIVELAAWVALENYRSRFNAGLGLRSQGFSDRCDLDLPAGSAAGRPG